MFYDVNQRVGFDVSLNLKQTRKASDRDVSVCADSG